MEKASRDAFSVVGLVIINYFFPRKKCWIFSKKSRIFPENQGISRKSRLHYHWTRHAHTLIPKPGDDNTNFSSIVPEKKATPRRKCPTRRKRPTEKAFHGESVPRRKRPTTEKASRVAFSVVELINYSPRN